MRKKGQDDSCEGESVRSQEGFAENLFVMISFRRSVQGSVEKWPSLGQRSTNIDKVLQLLPNDSNDRHLGLKRAANALIERYGKWC